MPLPDWAQLSGAARDAAYDNAAAVPERDALVRRRNEQAAAYRATHAAHLDIPYAANPRTKWDLYPAAVATAPCLIFIHGGYWQMNRREDFAGFAEGVAAHGWSVAMPGYTLAPEASLSQIVGELRAALDWLAAHGNAHGINGPCLLAGWSAGAQLAAVLLDHPLIRAGMAISGVFELGPLRDTYLNEKLQLTNIEILKFSPLRLPAVGKPLAIAYGTAELPALAADAEAFHAWRGASHAPGPLLKISGANHFTILEELRRPDGVLTRCLTATA